MGLQYPWTTPRKSPAIHRSDKSRKEMPSGFMSARVSHALTAPINSDNEIIAVMRCVKPRDLSRLPAGSVMGGSALIVWTRLEYQRLEVTDPRAHREWPGDDRAPQVGACAAVAVSAQRFSDEVQPLAAPPELLAGSAADGCGAFEDGCFGLA